MKKSGKRFESVVARVQKTNAIELASIYAPLQDAIVHRKKLMLMSRGTWGGLLSMGDDLGFVLEALFYSW